MSGITSAGEEAEELFERLVYRAIKTTRPSHGDKRVMLDDDRVRHVEIKLCGASSGGSANQVRAIKYHTLVIFTPNRETRWIVIPPNAVVAKIAERSRGQHSEVAFECATLSLGAWTARYSCDDDDLEECVIQAIEEGETHGLLRKAMRQLLLELKRKSHQSRREVLSILETGEAPEYWRLE